MQCHKHKEKHWKTKLNKSKTIKRKKKKQIHHNLCTLNIIITINIQLLLSFYPILIQRYHLGNLSQYWKQNKENFQSICNKTTRSSHSKNKVNYSFANTPKTRNLIKNAQFEMCNQQRHHYHKNLGILLYHDMIILLYHKQQIYTNEYIFYIVCICTKKNNEYNVLFVTSIISPLCDFVVVMSIHHMYHDMYVYLVL